MFGKRRWRLDQEVEDGRDVRERARLEALTRLAVMDTPREPEFDDVAALAADICGTSIGVVNLIGEGRQFFKAEVGLGVRETPLETSFCAEAILQEDFMVVPDARLDPRFAGNPLVTGEPHLRFYAGALLKTADRLPIGTVCVLDAEPKELTELQERTLKVLARQVMTQLELRLAVRERDRSEARHKAIVDSATDFAIVATDLDGRVTRWNRGAERVLGWAEEEMLGDTVERFFTPEDRACGRAAIEMRCALETGHGNDERWHMKADGTRFWAQGEMTPLRAADGSVEGFVKVLRDRTPERGRELRLQLLAQASGALLSADDPDAVIDTIVTAGADVLGIDQSYSYALSPDGEHLKLTHGIGLTDDVRDALREVSFDIPLCGIVAGTREPLIVPDLQATTEPRYALGRDAGIKAYAGFPIGGRDKLYGVISFCSLTRPEFDEEALAFFATLARFLSIGRERLDREAALGDLAMTLEHRVEERTRELMRSEEALRQSQKMDAVGQLTGGVAHDFNNLLTVIRGSVDLLKRPDLSPERRTRYIDAIADTADRAAILTGQLLAFARRQALQPQLFDVANRLANIADMLDSVTGARVQVATELPGEQCVVRADPSQFETALVNMAVNARDAMESDGTLTITVERGVAMPAIRGHAGAPGPFIAISIADTGTGIAEDDLARIFEPFFTTKKVGKGTGLGLSQVFGFAKQSGGDVGVESRAGQGSIFTLYLPEAEAGALPDAGPEQRTGSLQGDGLCVLVVEDNVDVGRFSTEALADFGYGTAWVASAEEALERLGEDGGGFDVVFSDVVMPGMGGLELAKRLARRFPDLPVILTSGYSHVLAQEGTHGFELLGKPYSADQLSRALQHATRGSTTADRIR